MISYCVARVEATNKHQNQRPDEMRLGNFENGLLTYLEGRVSERSRDAFRMRQALCLILRRLIRGRRERRVDVVVRKQLIDDLEPPVRDGIVKPQDSAELRRRVGECHGHRVVWCGWLVGWLLVVVASSLRSIFYIAEANCEASRKRRRAAHFPPISSEGARACSFTKRCSCIMISEAIPEVETRRARNAQ